MAFLIAAREMFLHVHVFVYLPGNSDAFLYCLFLSRFIPFYDLVVEKTGGFVSFLRKAGEFFRINSKNVAVFLAGVYDIKVFFILIEIAVHHFVGRD